MDILASKIEEACQHGKKEWPPEKKSVMDVMIPLEEYTTLKGEQTVKEAIFSLRASCLDKRYYCYGFCLCIAIKFCNNY